MTQTARSYERLEADSVRRTLEQLHRRIGERFPDRGLTALAGELVELAGDVAKGADAARDRLRFVRWGARALTVVVLVAMLALLWLALRDARGPQNLEWVPLVESAINDVVFAALALFFLHTLPKRVERGHLLDLLHRLRSIAHVIDMHQLTKDPAQYDDAPTGAPVRGDLTPFEMQRYLDYCSELLSLVGKVAALCAEESQDPVILETVGTIETLTTGMSREIWQKISLLPN